MAKRCLPPAVILALLFFASPGLVWPADLDREDPDEQAREIGERSETKAPQDPLVGTWQCSNGVFNYAIFFQADGIMIQQEPTFGKARNTLWTRLSEKEIALEGGTVLSIEMGGDDRMSVLDTRVGATWDCTRR